MKVKSESRLNRFMSPTRPSLLKAANAGDKMPHSVLRRQSTDTHRKLTSYFEKSSYRSVDWRWIQNKEPAERKAIFIKVDVWSRTFVRSYRSTNSKYDVDLEAQAVFQCVPRSPAQNNLKAVSYLLPLGQQSAAIRLFCVCFFKHIRILVLL